MAQMISKAHKVSCSFGCCHNLGNGSSASTKRTRRSLKRRDRQNALKGES
jgi:hypothetical protein